MSREKVPGEVSGGESGKVSAPGSRASTIRVPAFLNSLPRWLLQLHCGFRGFLRSILQPHRLGSQPTSVTSVWPMPPPYPEVFRSGAGNIPGSHLKRLVSVQVIALDWLHLNEAASAPECIKVGRRLSSRQWSAVKMLEHLGTDGNTPELVSAMDMGRSAAKIEGFEEALEVVSRCLHTLSSSAGGYFSGVRGQHAFEEFGELKCGRVIGSCDAVVATTAKPWSVSDSHCLANRCLIRSPFLTSAPQTSMRNQSPTGRPSARSMTLLLCKSEPQKKKSLSCTSGRLDVVCCS